MSLQNDSLHVFKFDFDPTDFHLQFDANKLHFLLKNGLTIKPGEVKLLHLQFFTDTQIGPEISSELRDEIALAPNLQFMPQLTIQQINLANCS